MTSLANLQKRLIAVSAIFLAGIVSGCSSDAVGMSDSEKCETVWKARSSNMSAYFALQNETGPILGADSLERLTETQLRTYKALRNEWAEIVLFSRSGCFSDDDVRRAKQIKNEE
jgi:hypothetical protein